MNKVPGIPFKTIENNNFYVDILWAIVIENRENLNRILKLNKNDFSCELETLCQKEIMQKTYSIAQHWVKNKKDKRKSKLVDLYYCKLSPIIVPYQLDNRFINKSIEFFVNQVSNILIKVYKIKVLAGEDVFQAKKDLAEYKINNFDKSNKDLKNFLTELEKRPNK